MMSVAEILLSFVLLVRTGTASNANEECVRKVIEEFVAVRIDTTYERYSIEYRNVPAALFNLPRDAQLRVVEDARVELRNNVNFRIEALTDGRPVQSFIVAVKIRRRGSVLLATEMIEKHELGESLAVTEETVETTTLPSDVVRDRSFLKGKRAKRIVTKGTVLTESMFEPVPMISRGSTVTLLLRIRSVLIRTKAVLLDDAGFGDTVLVQRVGTGEKLKATVVDENTVELHEQN
jgi:flagella basal body P-ring formation protein FlgA